jgi:gliding motility-associated-like protein
MRRHGFILLFMFTVKMGMAQPCTGTGQTPPSAIFVCGTDPYLQSVVGVCGSKTIPTLCNDGITHQDKNATWFRFACYSTGTIGFVITPNDPTDNYDWQLFDMTNRNPSDVLTDINLFLACNWSVGQGLTGASVDGTSLMVCSGPGEPPFSAMPILQQGHEYLLLVSNFSPSINGFQLQFNDGTAVITDSDLPKVVYARPNCDGSGITVRINRKVFCNSLSPDGSEFSILPAGTINSAFPLNCNGTEFDSLSLTLSSPLPNGNYILVTKNGTDGNTLRDQCGRFIAIGNSVPFTITSPQPTPLNNISVLECKAQEIKIIFQRPIRCNSISFDGSDFIVNGPQPVIISGVNNNCGSSSLTTSIQLNLSSPILTGGNYQLQLKVGNDGNTIIDECGLITPAGSSVNFTTKDAVSATFNFTMQAGCKKDTLQFIHPGGTGITNWVWTFDNSIPSNVRNPVMIFSAISNHTAQLIVTNGVCTDTSKQTIALNNGVNVAFEVPNTICPEDTTIILNKTTGTVNTWNWNFGNGNTSTVRDPGIIHFLPIGNETFYTIKLTAGGDFGCEDSLSQQVRVLSNCRIAVPTAFTPNNDGLNDYFYPLNAYQADNLKFKVFNRNGQVIFATSDWQKKWDGTINGIQQPAGVYVWILHYTHRITRKKYELKGTVMLIR